MSEFRFFLLPQFRSALSQIKYLSRIQQPLEFLQQFCSLETKRERCNIREILTSGELWDCMLFV